MLGYCQSLSTVLIPIPFPFCAGIDSSNNQDQVGKTVAIIVGVLAGLAVLVVLLSVCRRALGKF